jgi:hypothetical protein
MMATRPTRPKGYLTKGKVTSPVAARKAAARQQLTSARGLAGIVINSVLDGTPAGRGARTAKAGSKVTQVVLRNMRKKAAGVEQRKAVTSGQAKLVTSQMSKAPVRRTRDVVKKDSGRGLSSREKQQVTKPDTITRLKPNKPKAEAQIAFDKKEARGRTIRKSLTIQKKPGTTKYDASKYMPKHKVNVNTPKVRKVDTSVPKPVSSRSDEAIAERTQAAKKVRDRETRLQRRMERREYRRDTRAEKANPNRYSGPKKEEGNVKMSDRLADIGLQETDKAIARKAAERAKIGRTPLAQKKVDATLSEAAKARAAAARRNRVDSRKITVRKKRGE